MNNQVTKWFNALIENELNEVDKDIKNEKIWSLSDPSDDTYHDDNLKNLFEYKDFLSSQKIKEPNSIGFK